MTEYHTVYKGPAGETTQWDDIQRRLGNLPPKQPVWKPEKFTPEGEVVKDKAWVEGREAEELSDQEDEFVDDRFLEQYRQQRIRELREAARRPRFGSVEEIRGHEFVQQVTDASRGRPAAAPSQPAGPTHGLGSAAAQAGGPPAAGDVGGAAAAGHQAATGPQGGGSEETGEGEGLWVVVHLYKDGHGPSTLMGRALDELAARYPGTKFVRIVSTDCIPKYPDANLPTLLLYHKGVCVKHLTGLSAFGGPRTTPEQVALVLNGVGPICVTHDECDGDNNPGAAGGRGGEDARLVKALVARVVAEREEGDESSDFDD